jgi:S-DNA-T family DNA segregation ATPase FtsK/SpoIIIE
LPHVAGIITNLQSDASLVDRAYASLLGEQQRRQRMLHEAGNLDNIKQYQARWSMNPEMEPMPHLLMIVDEFAELIANRPDFLDLFITIGRVGRSLGLHLLLATQRIDEGRMKGLEGHLRYRICLRTFSAAESSAVLGNADAYYLPSAPGVGYFKVDTDIYSLFKTALISVPHVPASEQASPASQIYIFDSTGKLLKYEPATSLATSVQEATDLHTEMDVVLDRLSQPYENAQRIHQVWLPPLEKTLSLESLFVRYDQAGWMGVAGCHNLRSDNYAFLLVCWISLWSKRRYHCCSTSQVLADTSPSWVHHNLAKVHYCARSWHRL